MRRSGNGSFARTPFFFLRSLKNGKAFRNNAEAPYAHTAFDVPIFVNLSENEPAYEWDKNQWCERIRLYSVADISDLRCTC